VVPRDDDTIEQHAEEIVNQSVEAALKQVQSTTDGESDVIDAPGQSSEDDTTTLKIYTNTEEQEPEVETDVQEFEETLDDGTVIRRRITKTQQKQTIVRRIVMEGPEDELPTTEEQAEELLQQTGDISQSFARGQHESDDRPVTDVQEFEETLEDGTVVRRRIMTTTQQHLTTEKVVLEGESGDEYDNSYLEEDGHERVYDVQYGDIYTRPDEDSADAVAAAIHSQDEEQMTSGQEDLTGAEDADDEGEDTTRLILKKEVRTQKVIRDGKEETIITEDVHVIQEDEPPAEIEGSIQNVIDQFMGRSHSGQSSV
jgi:hypothetical protein